MNEPTTITCVEELLAACADNAPGCISLHLDDDGVECCGTRATILDSLERWANEPQPAHRRSSRHRNVRSPLGHLRPPTHPTHRTRRIALPRHRRRPRLRRRRTHRLRDRMGRPPRLDALPPTPHHQLRHRPPQRQGSLSQRPTSRSVPPCDRRVPSGLREPRRTVPSPAGTLPPVSGRQGPWRGRRNAAVETFRSRPAKPGSSIR